MTEAQDIAEYEVVFAARTGVTILLQKNNIFDVEDEQAEIAFCVCDEEPSNLVIQTPKDAAVLKNLQADYLEEAVERGFIMFYELEDDEVVRCTPCNLRA